MIKSDLKTNKKKNSNPYNNETNKKSVITRNSHLLGLQTRNQGQIGLTHINREIFHLLIRPSTFVNAWGNIRNNKGSLTPGVHDQTLQGFGLTKAIEIANKLKNGTFKPKPVRRKWIPKPGKKEKRPLGVLTIDDRIVKEAIRSILECIFEPEFKNISALSNGKIENFGFRPLRSTWDAIERFKLLGQKTDWVIEGDISKAYDTVDHDILLSILSRRITDKKFLKLIQDYLKAGIMDDIHFNHSLIGVPQSGIASPMLFNIYMTEFDKFVGNHLSLPLLRLQRYKPAVKKVNPLWKRYQWQARKSLNTYKGLKLQNELKHVALPHLKEFRRLKNLQLNTPYHLNTDKIFDLVYIRYADDWIIEITGPKALASYSKQKISSYLKQYLKFQLSPEKQK